IKAIATIRMMMTMPANANLSLRNLRQKICPGDRPMISAGMSTPSSSSSSSATGSTSTLAISPLSGSTGGSSPRGTLLGPRRTIRRVPLPALGSILQQSGRSGKDLRAQELAERPGRAGPFAVRLRSVRGHRTARYEQGNGLGRVGLPDARGRVVGRHHHDRSGRIQALEDLAEERAID